MDQDSLARIVMLTYGRMESGKGTYWCYVAVKPSEYDRFDAAMKNGALDLTRFARDGFGEIIVSGPGVLPPKEVTRDVARIYRLEINELYKETDARSAIEKKIAQLMKESGAESAS